MKRLLVECKTLNQWITSVPMKADEREGNQVYTLETSEADAFFVYKIDIENIKKVQMMLDDYTYAIEVHIEGYEQVDGEVGIMAYINQEATNMEYYPLNQVIKIDNSEVECLYLTLKLRGKGKFIFHYMRVWGEEKTISKVHEACAQKVKGFYEYYEANLQTAFIEKPYFDIRIATILDPFSYHCLKYEAHLKQLTYRGWEIELETFKPTILLVESAWEGEGKSWRGKIARFGQRHDKELVRLIDYCKEHNIKTVFWDKEGLDNVYYFAYTASLFDYIGVTDERVLEIHAGISKQNQVFVLPFAAQPKLHHNEGRMSYPLGKIGFAGTWYGSKYPDRLKDMEIVLDPARGYELDIFDRLFVSTQGISEENEMLEIWPEKYRKNIVGYLPYLAMVEAYKQYSIFLNVQSIKESKQMIPRRVYELISCGVPIISSSSEGLIHQFNEEIYFTDSPSQTVEWIEWILNHPEKVEEKVMKGRKKILEQHTYTIRMLELFNRIGVKV